MLVRIENTHIHTEEKKRKFFEENEIVNRDVFILSTGRCLEIFMGWFFSSFFVFFSLFDILKNEGRIVVVFLIDEKQDRLTSSGVAVLPFSTPFESMNFERPSTVRAPK